MPLFEGLLKTAAAAAAAAAAAVIVVAVAALAAETPPPAAITTTILRRIHLNNPYLLKFVLENMAVRGSRRNSLKDCRGS